MTTTVKAPRRTAAAKEPKQPKVATVSASQNEKARSTRFLKPSSKATAAGLAIGAEPRVHLLPPEVVARKRGRAVRRRLGLGLIGVIVLVVAGTGLATLSMVSTQAKLTLAQAQTASILQQQAKYGEVLKVKSDVSSIQSSQKLATAQEIAWQPFIEDLQKTLPSGGSITSVSAGIDTPFGTPVAVTEPLQGPRIATINVTAVMPQPAISAWLDTLPTLKGFVDATPNSVTSGESGNGYTVTATIHINNKALENRFAKAGN